MRQLLMFVEKCMPIIMDTKEGDMFVINTDAPSSNKIKICQNL